jgi:uroporphyrinogen decarboxylase
MSDTSRELVHQTLTFASPARIPRQLWVLGWAALHYPEELARIQERFPDDLITAPAFYREPLKTEGDAYLPGTFVDEWGCMFENRQRGIIGEVKEPLLRKWKDWNKVRIPRERLSVDGRKVNEFCRKTEKFILAGGAVKPFEQLQFIRGPANLYMDLAERPEELFLLMERMHKFYREELELWASTEVDALFFADDWGSQNSLLISPGLWRQMFKPLYKDYIDIAHDHGKFAFMHTDGYVTDILPDLIDLGLDALNAQLFCMDIEDLGNRFAGEIAFWGEIDRQYLLPFGTQEEVRAAVRRVKAALYRNGGVIGQCEFSIGARPENVTAVFEAWEE